ncbi:hypothetical protein [Halosimplex halophilum]|uniref:hypothetical protein n=1 Tax=Halosimplex halophilum TaxID=2559572 RepID=UPI00107FB8F2|nr:hypothetical protein [Halosimplex halophilum]
MTLGEAVGLSDGQERLLTRGLQAALAALAAYGVATGSWGTAVNGAAALAATFLPALIRREYGYAMDPGLVLWIAVAVFLNALGFAGLYEQYQWYDEITHTVSGTIIAGIGYASFRAVEEHSGEVDAPPAFRAAFVVVFVLAAGVVWELLEFASEQLAGALGADAPLVVYGVDDIVTDMIFNGVGGLVVALWGSDYVGGFTGFLRDRLGGGEDPPADG